MIERRLLVRLADLLDLDAERLGDLADHAAPCVRQRAREEQQRCVIERLREPHRAEQHLGLVVRVVVEDLEHAHGVDALTRARQRDRQQVVGEAGVDAGEEARRAALLARGVEPVDHRLVGGLRVQQLHHRARHHVGPGREDARDVVDRLPRPQVGSCGVTDTIGTQRKERIHVVRRAHPGGDQAAQFAGISAGLVGAVHPESDELEVGVADDAAKGVDADVAGAPLDDTERHRRTVADHAPNYPDQGVVPAVSNVAASTREWRGS